MSVKSKPRHNEKVQGSTVESGIGLQDLAERTRREVFIDNEREMSTERLQGGGSGPPFPWEVPLFPIVLLLIDQERRARPLPSNSLHGRETAVRATGLSPHAASESIVTPSPTIFGTQHVLPDPSLSSSRRMGSVVTSRNFCADT